MTDPKKITAAQLARAAQMLTQGQYPNGKANEQDEGPVMLAVGLETTEEGKKIVRIDFGAPVEWIGITPEQAVQLGNELFKLARKAGVIATIRL